MIAPMSLRFSCLDAIIKKIPIIARIGVNDVGFNKVTNKLFPSIPVRLRIHEVTVVPILAPIITPIA